ncbi:PadR family transcriptional regulator [Streptococcus sp. 121]|uniref:PadR family transcriptional regulator n=1 Tax=Streptococcus sp. 121 TaxID=2797637 RepID=UPI0018F06D85|nr:PadR family transcriptional regulator [Streptococcus sp. 121]MBJ6746027.1 PadR family transcriptional regulator [Streptococcus sp. 121]
MISDKLKRSYVPMTESAFYILFSLQSPQHGYGIGQNVKSLTNDEVKIGPGTMYGSLSKMERDGLIQFVGEEEKRKIYVITELGKEILDIEIQRIARLYRNSRGE